MSLSRSKLPHDYVKTGFFLIEIAENKIENSNTNKTKQIIKIIIENHIQKKEKYIKKLGKNKDSRKRKKEDYMKQI